VRRLLIACIALAVLAAGWGCTPARVVTAPDPGPTSPPATSTETPGSQPSPAGIAWLDTPLTDAVTGTQFRLSDYKGKPVLLHAFAVW
jgi:cytochrome oxidase Cu insertion factor (SCO1/SenC/PrrC family)